MQTTLGVFMKLSSISLAALTLTINLASPALAGGGGGSCSPAGQVALRAQNMQQAGRIIVGQGEVKFFVCAGERSDIVFIRASIEKEDGRPAQRLTENAKAALAYVNELGQPVLLILRMNPEADGSVTVRISDQGVLQALLSRRGVTFKISDLFGFALGETLLSL